MKATTEYFKNDWEKQIVLETIDDDLYIVIERTLYHFEGSIEVSEEVEYFKSQNEALDFIKTVHGLDYFGSEPKEEIDPEWDEIPF